MTKIYGKGAAMIHGMETALQMTYDRSVDIRQPPCWPNMPLKIVFK
jgi:gem associated protein 8